MKLSLFKLYWKYNYKQLVISAILLVLYCYYIGFDSVPILIILYLANALQLVYQFGERLKRIEKLKAKGLTEEDVVNIEFTKKWSETRSNGIWRYCIRDGGIIAGAGLSLVLSLLFFILFPNLFKKILAEPGNMLSFIGCAYVAGIIAGIILFRIMWTFKGKKFARLTDPLNTISASKKVSLDDLI